MATLTRFNGESSGCRTPDPLGLLGSSWTQKGTDHFEQDSSEDESGSRTPSRVANVNIEALKARLQELQAESAKCFEDSVTSLPPGLTPSVDTNLGGDVMKVVMNSNYLAQPFSSASPSLPLLRPPPLPHPELRSIRQEREGDAKAKRGKSMMDEQIVSKGSVGHPLHCAEACKYVKRKGGCQEGANCPNCHHCFWSKAHAGMKPKQDAYSRVAQEAHTGMRPIQETHAGAGQEDARLKEAQSLANKLVALLGGEEPFASKPQQSKVVKPELSVGTMGHPHSCAEACKYVRRKGGCMYGEACKNCHACVWSKKTQGYSSGAGFSSALAQDSQGSFANPAPVISLNALLPEPPLLPTNPTEELPAHQMPQELPAHEMPQEFAWEMSVGSMGHPHSCGPACKYALKSKGCKDGRFCSHCHLCRWMRSGVKIGNKQPIQITAWTSL